MNLFKRNKKDVSGKSRGMRITEGLLPIYGPATIGDSTAPIRPTTDAENARAQAIEDELERVTGPDGRVYLVERKKS